MNFREFRGDGEGKYSLCPGHLENNVLLITLFSKLFTDILRRRLFSSNCSLQSPKTIALFYALCRFIIMHHFPYKDADFPPPLPCYCVACSEINETTQCSKESPPETTSAQARKSIRPLHSAHTDTSASRTLTFGVEYEFLVASFPVGEPDPMKGGTDTRTIRFPTTLVRDYWAIHQALKDQLLEDDFEEFRACAEMAAKTL